jgi:hypothetical protein
MAKVCDDAESASSDENVGSKERSEKGVVRSEVGGADSQVQRARWSQVHPDNLVLNTRAVGIRDALTGRDEKEREQLVLQEGSEASEMQAVTLGLGWANSGADKRQ